MHGEKNFDTLSKNLVQWNLVNSKDHADDVSGKALKCVKKHCQKFGEKWTVYSRSQPSHRQVVEGNPLFPQKCGCKAFELKKF